MTAPTEDDRPLTLAVIDDERIFREGLTAWLGLHRPRVRLVAQAEGIDALLSALDEPPQVVVLDVRLPGHASLGENLRRLSDWGAAVVVVTSDGDNLEMIRVAVDHDALAFVHKGDGFEEIWRAVCSAEVGELYPNAALARYLRSHHPRLTLTDKQVQVLRWFVSGMQLREVAARMFVSEETVRGHLRAIRDKCGRAGIEATTRDDLRRVGTSYGLLDDWRA